MLRSTVFSVTPLSDGLIPKTLGNAFYRYFLNLIRERAGPQGWNLATYLHDTKGPKPFTTSPLQGPFTAEGEQLRLQPDRTYWLRVTSLDAPLSSIIDAIEANPPRTLQLHGMPFQVLGMSSQPGGHAWACRQTVENLYAAFRQPTAEKCSKVTLAFVSPTAFREKGRTTILPLPRLVFGSLLRRWNSYVPEAYHLNPALLHTIDAMVDIDRYQLETHMLNYRRYQLQIGFVGKCTFAIRQDIASEFSKVLWLLAAYAFYAGVGYRTAMGMGQARIVT